MYVCLHFEEERTWNEMKKRKETTNIYNNEISFTF